jgi:hypothetical protein
MAYSAATFESTYLAEGAASRIRAGAGRHRVAGAVYALKAKLAEGNNGAAAHALVDVNTRHFGAVVKAAQLMNDASIQSNYLLIDSP